jgi:hypothetical protein
LKGPKGLVLGRRFAGFTLGLPRQHIDYVRITIVIAAASEAMGAPILIDWTRQ